MPRPATALSPALEDYLEVILALSEGGEGARAGAIAEGVGVGKPAVTSALKALSARKLVHYDPYRAITLTTLGTRRAREVARRHALLVEFLVEVLAVDPPAAQTNACRMEHAMDRAVLDRLARLTAFLRSDPALASAARSAARRRRTPCP